jgi:hypothetical protein
MRRVIFLSLVVLAAAFGASAYALAGSPSQGMTAFALVDPNCNPDRLASSMHIRGASSA